MNIALRKLNPVVTGTNSKEDKDKLELWNHFKKMSLLIMEHGIPPAFRGDPLTDEAPAVQYLADIEKHFLENDKAETSTLLVSLISMKYGSKGNIRESILEMSHLASKINALMLELSIDLLVYLRLIYLYHLEVHGG